MPFCCRALTGVCGLELAWPRASKIDDAKLEQFLLIIHHGWAMFIVRMMGAQPHRRRR